MTVAAVQLKIMPEGVDTDLESIKTKMEEVIGSFEGGNFSGVEEQPIAFGLKALMLTFAVPESQEIDHVQTAIGEIEGVSSVELSDYRRAVG